MTSLPSFIIWFGLLAFAASSDVAARRIPNAIVVLVAGTSLAIQVDSAGLRGVLDGCFAALLVGVPMVIAWRRKLVGAGDVKLATAVAIGVGTYRVGWFALATALAAGVVAVACCLASTSAARRDLRVNLATLALGFTPAVRVDAGRRRTVPCAVAITAGAATAVLWGG